MYENEYTIKSVNGDCKDMLKYARMYENIRYNMQMAIVRICLNMLEGMIIYDKICK